MLYLFLAIAAIIALILFAVIALYNKLVHQKNLVDEAWSGIDVQLKRRYDLVPNLVATVQGYSAHEKGVLENVTRMRSAAINATNLEGKIAAEAGLSQALKTLFAVAENYPDLKANQNFLSLQKDLGDIENHLQLARRYYNGVAREYNTSIQKFPATLFAGAFGFHKAPFFEVVNNDERQAPRVSFH